MLDGFFGPDRRGSGPFLALICAPLLFYGGSAVAAPLFGAPSTYHVDGSPVSVGAIEIDRQLGLDLVIGNELGDEGPSVSLFLNRGQGSFFPERRINLNGTRFTLHAIAVGDFNGDGAGDFAVAVDDIGSTPIRTTVLVYRNDGSGNFNTAPTELALGGFFPQCLVAGDVTNDGVTDLVVCDGTVTAQGDPLGLITVLTGAGNGTFRIGSPIIVGSAPASAAIGNVDGDTFIDLVVADPDEGSVSILYGNGSANLFAAPATLSDSIKGPSAVLVGDIGNGGLPEVMVTSSPPPSQLLIYSQSSARTFTDPPAAVPVGFLPSAMAQAKFTADDVADLVILTRQGIELFRGTGTGFTLGEIVRLDGSDFDSLAVGNLNADNKPDVAAVSSLSEQLSVVLNGTNAPPTPGPTFTATATPRTMAPTPTRTRTSVVRNPTATRTATPTPTITRTPSGPGDANCDGFINQADVDGVITRIFVPGCSAADVNNDGRVNAVDLLLIIQMVAGA